MSIYKIFGNNEIYYIKILMLVCTPDTGILFIQYYVSVLMDNNSYSFIQ